MPEDTETQPTETETSKPDANARLAGATLDIAAGGMGVAASVNADLLVVAPASAAERTLVRIARASHYLAA